ncbi:MAG TPA: FHIPEP family type III secretion protein, partial [Novosphingobium sp.]|nr:FHIPEP family type III secretion protein [Novosphingobium sp.]
FAAPATWLPVAMILGAIGLIPAMPQTVFLPASGVAFWLWRSLKERAARQQRIADTPEPVAAPEPGRITLEEVSDHTLVTIELGYGLVQLVDEKRGSPLVTRVTGVRKQLSQVFGFVVPQFRVRDSLDVAPNDYRVLLGGVPVAVGGVRVDKVLAIDAGEAAQTHNLKGEATRDPSFGCPALWIDPAQRDYAIAEGFLTVDASTVIATHLNQILSERAHLLLGPDEVKGLIEALKTRAAGLVETVYPTPLALAAVTRILRALLEDGIPIGHPLPIFSSLSQAVQQTQDHDRLVDLLRIDLGTLIVGRICAPTERLPVITLDASLETMIAGGMVDPATGQPLIEPDLARTIGDRVAEIMAERSGQGGAGSAALIVQPRLRRALATLLRLRAPTCVVMSISELPETQPVEVIAVIGGDAPPSPALPAPSANPATSPQTQSMAA